MVRPACVAASATVHHMQRLSMPTLCPALNILAGMYHRSCRQTSGQPLCHARGRKSAHAYTLPVDSVHAPAAIERVTRQQKEVPDQKHDVDLPAASSAKAACICCITATAPPPHSSRQPNTLLRPFCAPCYSERACSSVHCMRSRVVESAPVLAD